MPYLPLIKFSPTPIFRNVLCVITAIAVASLFFAPRSRAEQSGEGLRLELPANGNLRIENLRGGVTVDVWSESYVAISAVADNGQPSATPPVVDRGASLLSVRLGKGSTRVNLHLHVPVRAHMAIQTEAGAVEVRGVSAALL